MYPLIIYQIPIKIKLLSPGRAGNKFFIKNPHKIIIVFVSQTSVIYTYQELVTVQLLVISRYDVSGIVKQF